VSVPTNYSFPASLTAGDTAVIQLSFGDYPATAWTASLVLNQPGQSAVSVAGAASGNNFIFTVPVATTAAMAVGAWSWAARVTETATSQVATADGGAFTLLANYATTVTKSIAQQQLDAANAALLTLAATPNVSVSFNGQSFTRSSQGALLDIIARLEAKVAHEQAVAAGLRGDAPTRSIRPYFV
jgi:ABC-type transporter Mla MlaB component